MNDTPVRSLGLALSDPFARQLLDSARTELSTPGARDRALLGLGLAPVGLLAAPPAAASAAAPVTAATALAAGGKTVPWVLAKSLALGLLGSLLAMSVLEQTFSGSGGAGPLPPPSANLSAAPAAQPVSHDLPQAALLERASETPSVDEVAAAAVPSDAPKRAHAPLEAPASAPSVADSGAGLLELEALARVRRALAARQSQQALELLDDFEQRFPASQVAEEALVLRIQSLSALGRTSEARALALRFLRDRPLSVYRAKVGAMAELGDQRESRVH